MSETFPLDVNVLREVLDRLNIGVYVTDLRRRILLWNKKAEQITGHLAETIVGSGCWDGVLSHVDKDGHLLCSTRLCPLYRAIHTGRESEDSILVYAKKADGRRVAVSVSVAPLRDNAGNVVGGIETFRDVSASVADMQFAAKIQQSQHPASLPDAGDVSFDVRFYPRDLVGGDFYDVREIAPGRFAFLVADVRGHGVSAALYTMWIKSLEERFDDTLGDPGLFLERLNAELGQVIIAESFATAVAGVLDSRECEVTYSSAGHPPLLCYRAADRSIEQCESRGMALGILKDEEYPSDRIRLGKGDVLLAYTDGLTDADTQAGMLGEEGLGRILSQEASEKDRNDLAERIYIRVLESCKKVGLHDDALVFCVNRKA